jgi:hypothetical protein
MSEPPTPQAISALRQHVIYCRGCQRAWYDESDDCACVCADPTSPRYEDWVVDPDPQDEPEGARRPVISWTDDPFWRCSVHNLVLAYDQTASDAADQDRRSCPAPGCRNGRWV